MSRQRAEHLAGPKGPQPNTILGAQLSEVLNEQAMSKDEGGISRRRVAKGVIWSVPVLVAAVGAPPAAASPGPAPAPASAFFTSEPQTVTSTVSTAHDRPGVAVPATLSLVELGGVTGNVEVVLTISPAPQAIGAVTLSLVRVGSTVVPFTLGPAGSPFRATFSWTLPAGATQLAFALSGFSYSGKKQDSGTFNVTTLITFQQGGQTKQLTPSSSIVLPKL